MHVKLVTVCLRGETLHIVIWISAVIENYRHDKYDKWFKNGFRNVFVIISSTRVHLLAILHFSYNINVKVFGQLGNKNR